MASSALCGLQNVQWYTYLSEGIHAYTNNENKPFKMPNEIVVQQMHSGQHFKLALQSLW